MTLETNNSEKPSYEVGYRRPPKHSQFQKGQPSANPKGRRPKHKNSLVEAMTARLDKAVPVPGTKRTKISTLQLMIRNLIDQALNEDMQAIIEVVRLTELKEGDDTSAAPYWYVTAYWGALTAKGPEHYTEEFFRDQDRRVAQWRRELKSGGRSLREIVEKELSRKTTAVRDGIKVTATVREAVVAAMLRVAARKPSLLKKLLKMLPEKKFKRDHTRMEVLRPTAEELKQYPAPGQTWEEWEEKKVANGSGASTDSEQCSDEQS